MSLPVPLLASAAMPSALRQPVIAICSYAAELEDLAKKRLGAEQRLKACTEVDANKSNSLASAADKTKATNDVTVAEAKLETVTKQQGDMLGDLRKFMLNNPAALSAGTMVKAKADLLDGNARLVRRNLLAASGATVLALIATGLRPPTTMSALGLQFDAGGGVFVSASLLLAYHAWMYWAATWGGLAAAKLWCHEMGEARVQALAAYTCVSASGDRLHDEIGGADIRTWERGGQAELEQLRTAVETVGHQLLPTFILPRVVLVAAVLAMVVTAWRGEPAPTNSQRDCVCQPAALQG